jgi:hypothetical protein
MKSGRRQERLRTDTADRKRGKKIRYGAPPSSRTRDKFNFELSQGEQDLFLGLRILGL